MRVFLVTMDSSCFGDEGEDFPDVAKLKSWQDNGWIDLIKTGVLERENKDKTGQYNQVLKGKTGHLSLDYGIVVYGAPGSPNEEHVPGEYIWWYGTGRSKFEDIYTILFGARVQRTAGKMRDALHLNTHLINDRDFFVTRDKDHILKKADELESHFGIRVRSPGDCIKEIEDYWKVNKTFPPATLTIPKIIAGTNIFEQFVLKRPNGSLIFAALKSKDNFFLLRGMLYSPVGKELIEFSEKPVIKDIRASLYTNPSEIFSRNRIVLETERFAYVVADYDGTKVFEARIINGGHLLLWGMFFDESCKKVAYVSKEQLELS